MVQRVQTVLNKAELFPTHRKMLENDTVEWFSVFLNAENNHGVLKTEQLFTF